MTEPRVTVLGLGAMGTALARALLAAGVRTTVWNRTPDRAEPLVAQGAARAEHAEEAVSAGDLVVVCVTDDDAADKVLESVAGAIEGKVVADLTSRTPGRARQAAASVAVRGAVYLDGTIQAGLDQIGTPEATLLLSGPADAYTAHRRALDALGTTHHVGGQAGQASLFDLALMGLWYDVELAYLQALALVSSSGEVDHEVLVPFAERQLGYVVGSMADVATEVRDRTYPRGPATLVEHAPVIDHLIAQRGQAGMAIEQLRLLRTLAQERIESGHGAEGFTGVIEQLVGRRDAG
jgi:3-hydroxyisobutyrate dehydrogenase-like beta-hydroxyacid dehydrogenase